jgi:hypothetical protein
MTTIRQLGALAALSVLLALPACGSHLNQEPVAPAPHKMGVEFGGPDCAGPLNPITGNNATIVVYDSTVQATGTAPMRLTVSGFMDQTVTSIYQIKIFGDSLWHTMNGAGDAITASTSTFLDYLVKGANNRIEITTGGTGPSTPVLEVCRVYSRDKGS